MYIVKLHTKIYISRLLYEKQIQPQNSKYGQQKDNTNKSEK